jgi:glutamate formiminotransferase/glutamate formiminotransferase/formiminotetrahydrofolate cyclodeaminase
MVADRAFTVISEAVVRIDLTKHAGVHPRLGAADVVPFVPIEDATIEDCAAIAHATGERIWRELHVPVYFYEAAARRHECVRLENIRRNALAGLHPDLGEGMHPTAGVCVVGAREFLIAWNIILKTDDLAKAQAIAAIIRESGAGLPAVKALGLALPSRGSVQVSINLTDFRRTPLHSVFDAVTDESRKRGILVEGSELIGMIPQAALAQSQGHDLLWLNLRPDLILENQLHRKSG